jgi:uncharacterized membrane protein
MTLRTLFRLLLAALYAYAGYAHIARPEPFLAIMPPFVPWPEQVVLLTGIAELLGAAALAQPFSDRLRWAGGAGLALYALCVWPANVNHMMMDLAAPDGGWGMAYHGPRMLAQAGIIWLALWCGGVTEWHFKRGPRPPAS